jgi:acyl-CoA hydrolase
MTKTDIENWEKKVVSPEKAFKGIDPGMCIFLSTGTAEPRTLVRHLMDSSMENLQDLELFQLLSFGDALSLQRLQSQKYRLKTFALPGSAACRDLQQMCCPATRP